MTNPSSSALARWRARTRGCQRALTTSSILFVCAALGRRRISGRSVTHRCTVRCETPTRRDTCFVEPFSALIKKRNAEAPAGTGRVISARSMPSPIFPTYTPQQSATLAVTPLNGRLRCHVFHIRWAQRTKCVILMRPQRVLSYRAHGERPSYGQVYASVIQSVGIRALPWRQFSMTASRNQSSRRFT